MRATAPVRVPTSAGESQGATAPVSDDRSAVEVDAAATPQALLVFAHPDDEVIALGARLGRYANEMLVHVTDGAPRNEEDSRAYDFATWREYREARETELQCMLSEAGLPEVRRRRLEIPDQEASLRLAELTRTMLGILRESGAEVILTHAYEGGHPDHDACAFAVHQAVRLQQRSGAQAPVIIECALYHAGPTGIETGSFLPSASKEPEVTCNLTAEERRRKQALIDCFTTQRATLKYFSAATEKFRIAPHYDFTKPPHAGPAFYDNFPWGMTSKKFCELAREAQQALGMGDAS